MMNMREKIAKLGRVKVVVIMTVIAVLAASSIAFVARKMLGITGFTPLPIIIPSIVVPSITWYIIGLLIEIHQLERDATKQANYDMLTEVLTRRGFLTQAETLYKVIFRNRSSFVFAYIDVDNFKQINDEYGHHGGDEVLKSFALLVKKLIRESDLVGRLGGEEFGLVLPDTDIEGAKHILDKICLTAKNSSVMCQDRAIKYTISIGVALFNQDNIVDLEELIKQADTALYRAKKSGKGRVVEY